ncbi:uncharacterized protein [Chironomus tepperi]|uniref:uncharacterized protein n=1 Tax=Chironomus tepperi TaxID=113505 RepID=UPI00391F6455
MVLYKIILTISLIAIVYSLPFDDNKENNSTEGRGISVNDLFKEINKILEHNIESAIGSSSVEIGDNFTSTKDDGKVQITVEKFEYGVDKFPVTFEPDHSDESLEDDDVVPLEGDYDEVLIFKEECYGPVDESSDAVDTTTTADQSTTIVDTSTVPVTTQSPTTASKDVKLLNDVAAQPILTTV